MNNTDQQIPAEWLLYDFSFRLFATFEKKSAQILEHQVSFVPIESISNKKRIAEFFEIGITPDDFKKKKKSGHVMIIKLSGEFYSIDKILFENLFADNNELNICLNYIRVESFDGDPFEVDFFLIIPIDISWNKLSIDFQAFKKNFITNLEETLDIEIPRIEINFSYKQQ